MQALCLKIWMGVKNPLRLGEDQEAHQYLQMVPIRNKMSATEKARNKLFQFLQIKGALQRQDCSAAMTSLFLIAESIASLINHDGVTNDQFQLRYRA